MRGHYSYEGLDPVVVAALEELQHRLMEMNRHGILVMSGTQPDLTNFHARNAAIWTFKHLRRVGLVFEPHLVERWALENGWRNANSLLLRDYATAINAGARFHAGSDPYPNSPPWLNQSERQGSQVTDD